METCYYTPFVNKVIDLSTALESNDTKYGWSAYKKMRIETERNLLAFAPKVLPDRYLWHVSYPIYRERILKNGIIPNKKEHYVLFVNAQIENPLNLWPIVYDDSHMMFNWDDYDEKDEAFFACAEMKLLGYDYWRIDSEIAGYDGYHIDMNDPAFMSKSSPEKGMFGTKPDEYLCRVKPIKANALKLYRYKRGSFRKYFKYLENNEPLVLNINEGVTSVQGFDKASPYFLEKIKINN